MDMNIADNVYYKNPHNDAINDSIDDRINNRINNRISDPIDDDESTTIAAKANELAVAQHEVELRQRHVRAAAIALMSVVPAVLVNYSPAIAKLCS
jgi:hypothetical protein